MISMTRYISITSGVAGGIAVALRELITRVFTTNELLPTGTIQEFESADDVGAYFGTSSEEYKRAAFYFGWISKSITKAKKIAFARWADEDTAPMIFGTTADRTIATFTAISNGSLRLTLGADTNDLTAMDFSGAASLAAVAAIIETAIQAETGTMWTAATVSYNAVDKRFELIGGDVGAATVATADVGSGTAIRLLIGWGNTATFSDGAVTQTIPTLLGDSTELNNNFGSFVFIPTLTADEILEAAIWNDTQNNMFQFLTPVVADDASALSAAIIGYSGAGIILDPEVADEYPEMIPGIILAATDYTKPNAAKNYMYQQFPDVTASVTSNTDANTYDALRINYVGRTQTAGQILEFFQRGFLCGGSSDAVDMGVYANEQWFKDACSADLMTLLLAVDQVQASSAGVGTVLATLQSRIDQALLNGTIEPGKDYTAAQKQVIANLTNDQDAWHQVQSIGYWVTAAVEPYVLDDITQYKISYTIVYGKGDSIRKIEGRDIMI